MMKIPLLTEFDHIHHLRITQVNILLWLPFFLIHMLEAFAQVSSLANGLVWAYGTMLFPIFLFLFHDFLLTVHYVVYHFSDTIY